MNIQCMNCEFDHQCIDCMYNKKQMENDIKNENRGEPIHLNKKRIERIERNKQKKTADMRTYKREMFRGNMAWSDAAGHANGTGTKI